MSTHFVLLHQDAKGEDAEGAAARKEELRAKMMDKSRDGQRWVLVCSFSFFIS